MSACAAISAKELSVSKSANVAHRGASAAAPENTIAAARIAIAEGAGGIECDVRITKDGVPVLINDANIKKYGAGETKVADMTLDEIQKVDAGAWKNAKFKGEKIPTLEQFLNELKPTGVEAIIELKIRNIEEPVIQIVKKTGMEKRAAFISFDAETVKKAKEAAPEMTVAWLYSEDLKDKGTPEANADRMAEFLIAKCKELKIDALDLAFQILSKPLIEKLNAAGIRVWCYTLDDGMRMKQLLDWGVEKITTNRPEVMTKQQSISKAIADQVKPAAGMPVHVRRNVGHRGASFVAPENTIPAYKQAIADGATGAECDIYESTDGVIFLTHDHKTTRTLGGGDFKVWELSYTDILKRDAGVWKDEKFKGTHAPTLEEYLNVLKGTTCHPVIEIKRDGFEQKVADAVRKAGMTDVSTVIAFSTNVVREIRRVDPTLSVAWLYGENMSGKDPEKEADRLFELILWRCHELDTCIVDLQHTILSEKLIKKLQQAKIHVWCWTVNDEARMNQLLDWGIESITTDKPDLMTKVLNARK